MLILTQPDMMHSHLQIFAKCSTSADGFGNRCLVVVLALFVQSSCKSFLSHSLQHLMNKKYFAVFLPNQLCRYTISPWRTDRKLLVAFLSTGFNCDKLTCHSQVSHCVATFLACTTWKEPAWQEGKMLAKFLRTSMSISQDTLLESDVFNCHGVVLSIFR